MITTIASRSIVLALGLGFGLATACFDESVLENEDCASKADCAKNQDCVQTDYQAMLSNESSVGWCRPEGEGCAILDVVVRHTTPTVRPDDILTALRAVSGFCPPAPPLVTRLAQGPLTGSGAQVADPLAAEKDAAGP